MTRPALLHISADYPDQVEHRKTVAVRNLVHAADWADHLVISINRVVRHNCRWRAMSGSPTVATVEYFGFPYGVGLRLSMRLLSTRIQDFLRRNGARVDLIHAHKLTYEGLVASRLATSFGVPYMVTVRGDTDLKVIAAKPTLRRLYRQVLFGAKQVFVIAPWTYAELEKQLRVSLPPPVLLPNICRSMAYTASNSTAHRHRLVSVFHFREGRRKNADNVFKALRQLRQRGVQVELDVIGAGNERELREMTRRISLHGVEDCARALPAMPPEELQDRLPQYAGLVLPSFPETFGMVFIEALTAGIPVIHAKRTGIDGYFRDHGFAIPVNHRDIDSIARAMMAIFEQRAKLQREIETFRDNGGFAPFEAESARRIYRAAAARLVAD